MAGLTAKNKQAIDVYLGAGSPEAKGSGTKAWQEVYKTKNAETARANWARMLANASARQYLDQRQAEIGEAVRERVVLDRERAINDLMEIQGEARGDGDYNAAVKAIVEAGKFAEIYVTKSESTSTQVTPEDRQYAALYGLGVTEYLERKAAGTLPPKPEIPKAKPLH